MELMARALDWIAALSVQWRASMRTATVIETLGLGDVDWVDGDDGVLMLELGPLLLQIEDSAALGLSVCISALSGSWPLAALTERFGSPSIAVDFDTTATFGLRCIGDGRLLLIAGGTVSTSGDSDDSIRWMTLSWRAEAG